MSRLAVIATIKVLEGSRDRYVEALLAHRARCLAEEAGTIAFEVLVPHDKDDEVRLYEVYVDKAAFDAHMRGASIAEVRRSTADIKVSLAGDFCSVPV